MPRISMQQAYDNRDVIAQIYKMLADVADSVAKATEAVAKALEAMETAETAEEAVAGKQDALTEAQLGAIETGENIFAAIEDANAGDVLLLDENKDPSWGELELLPDTTDANAGDALVLDADKTAVWGKAGIEPHTFATKGEFVTAITAHPDSMIVWKGHPNYTVGANAAYIYVSRLESGYKPGTTIEQMQIAQQNRALQPISNSATSVTLNMYNPTIIGNTSDNNLEVKSGYQAPTMNFADLVIYY